MDLAWLDDFLALSAQGNFSRAAEARHVTQPAFSRRIRALELWAGTALFDRSSHRVALTTARAAFHESAEALVRDLELARSRAREAADEAAGIVAIASTHMLALTSLPGRLAEAEPRLAGASIQLLVDTMAACERLTLAGRVALLLCHHYEAAPSSLDDAAFLRAAVGHDRLVAVSAPDNAGRPRHALRDDGETDYLAFRGEAGLARILDATLVAHHAGRLRPVFHSHAALTLITMARAGRGLMFAPEPRRRGPPREARWSAPAKVRSRSRSVSSADGPGRRRRSKPSGPLCCVLERRDRKAPKAVVQLLLPLHRKRTLLSCCWRTKR